MFGGCTWLNEPGRWQCTHDTLTVVTDHGTDFWRETQYGFVHDSGHLYAHPTAGDFTAQVCIRGAFEALYDQAGLMVRVDETRWIKAGIEFSDGAAMLGSVLTNGQSDWATGPYSGDPAQFWMRVTVKSGVVRVQASTDGKVWPLVRLAPFPKAATYLVGPMCCTPERSGLEVAFSAFRIAGASDKALHDLS